MKYCLWIMLLPGLSLFAKDQKLGGYVLDATAFRKIQSYCVDTHNQPPREVKVINQFVARESRPQGLLSKLPWRRTETCRAGEPDAIVRLEFPTTHFESIFMRREINGVLFVFRAGSPSPIYETKEVLMTEAFDGSNQGFNTEVLEHGALYYVVRMLLHDWQRLSAPLRPATS